MKSPLSLQPVESWAYANSGVQRGGSPARRLVTGERLIVSRALCHFELVDAPPGGASKNARKAAELAAKSRTPFPDPQVHLDFRDGVVGVWSWPSSAVADLRSADTTIIPETLTRTPAEGAVLAPCVEGVEGIIWKNGSIVASRWWPQDPTKHQWAQFVRSHPEQPLSNTSVTAEPNAAARSPAAMLAALGRISIRDLLAAGALLILAPTLFLTATTARQWVQIMDLEQRLDEVQVTSGEILDARTQFVNSVTTLSTYSQALGQAHPAEMLAIFSEAADGFEAELMNFRADESALTIVLRGTADLPLPELVSSLESNPNLSNVLLEPTNRPGDWRISATINPADR